MAPQDADIDTYKENSCWWIMRDLLEITKGNKYGEKFNVRQPIVRRVLDELERKWQLEAKVEEERAINLKLANDDNYKEILSEFTERCVLEAIKTAENLKNIIQEEKRKYQKGLRFLWKTKSFKILIKYYTNRTVYQIFISAKHNKSISLCKYILT